MRGSVQRLDRYQREHDWAGLPLGVAYKFFDDRGPHMAALVTYYGFVSLFPLLLLLFSGLGFFLQGHPRVRMDIEQSVLRNFPTIGSRLSHNLTSFRGSEISVAVGVLGTLYGGLGALQAAQASFNHIWGVPRNEQPNPLRSRLRSLGLLAVLGSVALVSAGGSVLLSTANDISSQLGPAIQISGYLVNLGLSVALFTATFRMLTAQEQSWRQVLPGAVFAGAGWMLVQILGSLFIASTLTRSNSLYGVFAVVLATLALLYVQSLIVMVAAEINAVISHRLWPRSLLTPFTDAVELTPADRRAYELYVRTQRFKSFERVGAEFAEHEV